MSLSHDETRARLARAEADVIAKAADLEAAQAKVLDLEKTLDEALLRLDKVEADVAAVKP